MSQLAFDLTQARAERDAGMRRSLDRAERAVDGWSEIAYTFLLIYARHHEYFISEDVNWASKLSLAFPQPPTDKAWGGVYRRAVKEGVMVKTDRPGISLKRHCSPCPVWRSLIYVEVAG